VGKTTLLLEIAKEFGSRALYASADAPEASLPGWGDRVWRQAREKASGGCAILLLDEVQQFPDWSRWLKGHFDAIRREELPLRVVASGSSSLRIGAGARESMAGRFERHELMQWNAGDLAARFGLSDAARRFITQGGYPGATRFWDEPERWRDYIHHAIVDPIIGRDILQLEQVRKPALLRQVFAMAAVHPAEILSLEKIAGTLAEKGSLETIAHYLELLREAYLVTPLQKFAAGEMRRRRSPPKLVVMDNALLGREGNDPNPLRDPTRWGRWVENACLAEALHRGLDVSYWRQEPWEVDAVIQGGEGDWLVETKPAPMAIPI
jgi:hypothetical protein